MKTFNLNSDEWDGTRDREGWRVKGALIGQHIGGDLIGATMSEVEPGCKLWPYHTHYMNEEWVIVLRGEPTLRTPEGEQVLKEGDVVCFPRGKEGAHQIINGTDSPIRVLMLSSMIRGEIIEYLDTGKVLAKDVEDEDIMFARPGPRSNTGKARTSSARELFVPIAQARVLTSRILVEDLPIAGKHAEKFLVAAGFFLGEGSCARLAGRHPRLSSSSSFGGFFLSPIAC